VATVLSVSVAGCATTAQMKAAAVANQPIQVNVTKAAAKEAVAGVFIAKGYRITNDSDFVLEFSVPTSNVWAAVLLSSNYDSTVMARVQVQFVGDNPTTVTWRAFLVTNPGSAFERLTDMSHSADAPNIQAALSSALNAIPPSKAN
jgi:hypothetical protein